MTSAPPATPGSCRLFFVGPMVGRTPGFVTTQGTILADLFRDAGYRVRWASSRLNRYARLADILLGLARHGRSADILCLEVYGGPSFVVEDAASRLARLLGLRVVLMLHGGALPEFFSRHPRWTRRVLSRADLLAAPTPYLARAAADAGFRAEVVPNVLDLDRYPFRLRERLAPRFLWMRTFHPVWNPEMALRGFALFRRRAGAGRLVMAGQDKGLLEPMRRLAAELGVAADVEFPGFLGPDEKVRAASAADVFVTTNRVDNTPVAVLEAAAFGLPVVSTAVGGIPDLLTDRETALLVPDDDPQALARALHTLLDEPELGARLSAAGRRLAERSSWAVVRGEWERLFGGVLEARARTAAGA